MSCSVLIRIRSSAYYYGSTTPAPTGLQFRESGTYLEIVFVMRLTGGSECVVGGS